MKTIKKLLICMTFAGIFYSCGSNDEVFESWKGWVAMNTCSYNLQEEFKKEYANKGDISSLFYEHGEVEMSYLNGSPSKFTSDLNDLAESIYKVLSSAVNDKYENNIKNGIYKADNDIIMDVIQEFILGHEYTIYSLVQRKSDNAYFYMGPPGAPTKFYEEKGKNWIDIYYNVDWLFRNENNLKTLADDLLGLCGRYSDFYDFVMGSVSVLDSEWIESRAGSDVYNVIYQIDTKDSTKYALCQILVNEENSEIQLINTSDSLMNLY
ncbi:hypothetical protein B5F83_10395 [Muribaculum sp. An289]|uniref:hypothetical protein n=1 Tax=unclassified Muribaculum TaxID=2622126 RepID=UPI000B398FB6|nr:MULTISPECIES: hypothetical protein [unclassified Muribaculum]OUO34834.1 hypothetical protein B5F83_10395 [Muribaculum sp. An289]OUO40314.1 hypothetical protein B5F81_10110 [Muribaculum sp. An287]